jgi:catechol 2,3-dioxygenase
MPAITTNDGRPRAPRIPSTGWEPPPPSWEDEMTEKLLSQLAHVEILSPRPQDSVDFFTRVLGLQESGRDGRSVYLRGWSEFFHHSL